MSRDRKGHGPRVVDLEELQWLPRHVRGDSKAFSELMSAYRAPVWNYLARCRVNLQLREDLFQDIFLKIHQSAPSYRATWPLRPWVFTIAANTLRNHVRDRKRHRQIFTLAEELPEPIDPTKTSLSCQSSPPNSPSGNIPAACSKEVFWMRRSFQTRFQLI